MKTTAEQIKDICFKIRPTLDFSKNLRDQLKSLELAEVIIQMESVFQLEFNFAEVDLNNFSSIDQMIQLVERQKNRKTKFE